MTEREVVNAKKRELYRTRKESGLCTMCGKPREATAINITRCEACRAMRKKGYVAKKDFEKYRLKKELQTLRRKAEPVQPISRDSYHYTIRDTCPVCDNHLYIEGAYRMKYCCDCGQAIDWSKE